MNQEFVKWIKHTVAGRLADRIQAYWNEPPPSDPWSLEENQAVQADDALPLCPHCLAPQEGTGWFCPKCGAAVGPYNNLMPFINTFSIGEVALAGTTDAIRNNWMTRIGYVLFALSAYSLLFPVYLICRMFRKRKPSSAEVADKLDEEERNT